MFTQDRFRRRREGVSPPPPFPHQNALCLRLLSSHPHHAPPPPPASDVCVSQMESYGCGDTTALGIWEWAPRGPC